MVDLYSTCLFCLSILGISIITIALPNQVKIGILLSENQYEQEIIFKWSIEQVNNQGLLNRTKLHGVIKKIVDGDSWDAERKTCELFEEGTIAIVGPSNVQSSQHIGYICDALDVPHLSIVTRGVSFNSQPSSLMSGSDNSKLTSVDFQSTVSVDLGILGTVLSEAYLDVVKVLGWDNFIYLYEKDDSLFSIQQHFDGKRFKSSNINIKILRFDPSKPYRDAFWLIRRRKKIKNIMLDVKCSNLRTILKHAQQVSMMTEYHSYLLVCLDTQTLDLEDFKYSKSRIIWLNIADPLGTATNNLMNTNQNEEASSIIDSGFRFNPELIKTESALVYDAIKIMAHTLQGVDSTQYMDLYAPVSCNRSKPWPHGSTIVNYLRTSVEVNGMTGKIRFNTLGQRSDYQLNIVRLTEDGPKIIGNWTEMRNNSVLIDNYELQYIKRGDPNSDHGDQRDLLVVTSKRHTPYFSYKRNTKSETGNARYEGYAIDLMDELSRIVGFDYTFKEVDDGKYGQYDAEKKEWNGMIREVMTGKADLAIGDLSITSSREDVVDFTLPFMSTGISLLFKKPTTKELELFSFLSPFETHVWVYVCGAYVGVSSLLFIVGRISPYEWADPHPCRREDKILRNQFSVNNSFWFTIAALMQQGSDLAPRSLSTRLVAAIWYFFTLIMISSYTANLAAFLTVEKIIYPIEKAEDLYKHPMNIKYGCVEIGSTHTFFRNSKPGSTFKKMFYDMTFVQSNEEGTEEVIKGNYAFFMESTSIEYTIEGNCNLTQLGGLLDSKGYGIALAKNSTRKRDYRTKLSEAILSLQESGTLEILKNRWWKEKRGGTPCDADDGQSAESVKELTLANVGGVFVVLGMGITISFIICAFELFSKSCRLAAAQGTNRWTQARRRIALSLAISENY